MFGEKRPWKKGKAMKTRCETMALKIAAWTLLAGTVPVGEVLPAEGGSRIMATSAPVAAPGMRASGKALVRSALLTSEETRALPTEIQCVVMKDGRKLWARSLTRTSAGLEIQPITGGKLLVELAGIQQVKQVSRGAYLSHRWQEIQTARRSALSKKTLTPPLQATRS